MTITQDLPAYTVDDRASIVTVSEDGDTNSGAKILRGSSTCAASAGQSGAGTVIMSIADTGAAALTTRNKRADR